MTQTKPSDIELSCMLYCQDRYFRNSGVKENSFLMTPLFINLPGSTHYCLLITVFLMFLYFINFHLDHTSKRTESAFVGKKF